MSQEVSVTLRAIDGASTVFRAVGTAGASLASQLTSAGAAGSHAFDSAGADAQQFSSALDSLKAAAASTEGELKQVGTSVEGSGRSFSETARAGKEFVDSLRDVSDLLGEAARAAAEEEAELKRLEAAITATGQSYDDYAKRIDDAIAAGQDLAFSDSDVVNALSDLTTITGDAGKALDLLATAQDLARGKGIDLAAAATIVGKVAEGNTAVLSRYGIVLEDVGSGQEALASLQSRFAGQAQAYGDSTQGALDKVRNAADNLIETIGAGAGQFQGFLAVLPGIAQGAELVGGALGKAAGGVKELAAAAKESEGAMAALALATGPVGLAAAAVAAVAGLVALIKHEYDAGTAADEAARSTDVLTKAILELNAAGLDTAFAESAVSAMQEISNAALDAQKTLEGLEQQRASGAIRAPNRDEVLANLDREIALQQQQAATTEEVVKAKQDLATILTTAHDNQEVFNDAITLGIEDLRAGRISVEQFFSTLDTLANNPEVVEGIKDTTDAMSEAQKSSARYATEMGLAGQSARLEAQAMEELNKDVRDVSSSMDEGSSRFSRFAGHEGGLVAGAKAAEEALHAQNQALLDAVFAGNQAIDVLAGLEKGSADFAAGLSKSATAMDAVLSTFDQIDALGQRYENAVSIADALIGDPGEWATIDDLVTRGRISQQEYNDAVMAGLQIQTTAGEVEDSLNTIRAKQIPLLADQAAGYQDMVRALSEADAETQQQALYLMDSANAAKVATAEQTAYAAALGQIPKDVATDLIVNAAQADPILKSILEDYGLISEGADGTITVNFPDGDSTTTAVRNLTDSIDALISTLGGIPPVHVTAQDEATPTLAQVKQTADQLDGTVVTIDVQARAAQEATNAGAMGGLVGGRDQQQTVELTADTSGVEQAIGDATKDLQAWEGTGPYEVELGGMVNSVEEAIKNATADLEAWAKTGPYVATLGGMIVDVEEAIKNATADLTAFAGSGPYVASLGGNIQPVEEAVKNAEAAGNDFAAETFTATLDANDGPFWDAVNAIDGQHVATVWVDVKYNDPGPPGGGGGGGDGGGGKALGGAIQPWPSAAYGRVVTVGEVGREDVWLPYGAFVTPHAGSRGTVRGAGDAGAGGATIYVSNLTVVANDPQAMYRQIITEQRVTPYR